MKGQQSLVVQQENLMRVVLHLLLGGPGYAISGHIHPSREEKKHKNEKYFNIACLENDCTKWKIITCSFRLTPNAAANLKDRKQLGNSSEMPHFFQKMYSKEGYPVVE